jgi:hypothetical protein
VIFPQCPVHVGVPDPPPDPPFPEKAQATLKSKQQSPLPVQRSSQ